MVLLCMVEVVPHMLKVPHHMMLAALADLVHMLAEEGIVGKVGMAAYPGTVDVVVAAVGRQVVAWDNL